MDMLQAAHKYKMPPLQYDGPIAFDAVPTPFRQLKVLQSILHRQIARAVLDLNRDG